MESDKIYVGLDIGTTKVVAMVGTTNRNGKIQILGYGVSKPQEKISKGVAMSLSKTATAVMQATDLARRSADVDIKEVMVGISGQNISTRTHSDYISRISPEKLIDVDDLERLKSQVNAITLGAGERIIHALPQYYKVDSTSDIKDPIGMVGGRLDATYHLVIGQTSAINNVNRTIEMANLKAIDITLEPIASAEAVLTDDEKEGGVVLVDIGGGTTDVAIFKEGIIRHAAVIPFGGAIITEDIQSAYGINAKYAEEVKVTFGSAWPGEIPENEIITIPGKNSKEISLKSLSKIIHSRVSEIINLVHNVIKSYGHEDVKNKLHEGIVLTGGGSQMQHIVHLVKYITGMNTRVGYPDEYLVLDNNREELRVPTYATSIGLVMCAIEKEKEEQIKKLLAEKQKKKEEEERLKKQQEDLLRQQNEEAEKEKEQQLKHEIKAKEKNNDDDYEEDDEEDDKKEKKKGISITIRSLGNKIKGYLNTFNKKDEDDDEEDE